MRRSARWAPGSRSPRGRSGIPIDQYLLFSDMPADVRRRWDAERGVVEVRRPSNKCNGMTYDAELNLIVCEHATSLLVRERPDGRREVLASHFERQELNSPNDVCVRSDGRSISPTRGMGACRASASSGRASSAFRASIACRPAAARRNSGRARALRSAERPVLFAGRDAPLRQRHGQTLIRVFDVAADGSLVERPRLRLPESSVARGPACPTA